MKITISPKLLPIALLGAAVLSPNLTLAVVPSSAPPATGASAARPPGAPTMGRPGGYPGAPKPTAYSRNSVDPLAPKPVAPELPPPTLGMPTPTAGRPGMPGMPGSLPGMPGGMPGIPGMPAQVESINPAETLQQRGVAEGEYLGTLGGDRVFRFNGVLYFQTPEKKSKVK